MILFFAIAYLARTLGPHNFGIINFAEGVLTFFVGVTSLGLDYIGMRDVAKDRGKTDYLVGTIVSMRLLLAFASFVLLTVFVIFLDKPLVTKYVTVIYGLALFCAAFFVDWVFQGLERMQFVAAGSIIKAVVFILGVFFFTTGHEDIVLVSIIYFLSRLVPAIILLFFYVKSFGFPGLKIDLPAYRSFLKDSLPIGLSIMLGWVMLYFDSTMLFLWKGEGEAGVFSAAFKPVVLITVGIVYYLNAIFPTISRAAMDNTDMLRRIINTSIGGILTFFLPLAVAGNYLAGDIIKMLYGEKFIGGTAVLGILLWWPVVGGVVNTYIRTLIVCGKQRYIIWGALTTAVLNIILNIALIPVWSGVGAAIAKVGADLVTFLFYFIVMKNIVEIPVFKILFCPLVSAIAMFAYLKQDSIMNIWLGASLGLIIYFSILFLMSRIMPIWMKSMIEARV
ncbi:MAG: flippase [Deltaproteobacteria bacterium]|nr:flippase [Deltaproteobacteria bacterium]